MGSTKGESEVKSQVLCASRVIKAAVAHIQNTRKGKALYETQTGRSLRYSDKHDVERYVNETFDYWLDHYLDSK